MSVSPARAAIIRAHARKSAGLEAEAGKEIGRRDSPGPGPTGDARVIPGEDAGGIRPGGKRRQLTLLTLTPFRTRDGLLSGSPDSIANPVIGRIS